MTDARKIVLSVLGGGLVLGTVLGVYADPEMTRAPEPEWRLSARPAIEPGPVQHFVSFPEDLSPHGGYRPGLDYTAEITDWSPRYPRWAYSDFDAPAWDEPEPEVEPVRPYAATDEIGIAPEPPRLADAAPAAREGHRIARIQADGLW